MSYEQQLRSPRKAHRTSAAWPASRSGQASCLEVETLSDPEEHISRPVASASSGKCLRLLACRADCSPCNKWESILLDCNNPPVSVWAWQGAECRQKLTVEEFSSLEYVPGVGYLMSISTVHLRHKGLTLALAQFLPDGREALHLQLILCSLQEQQPLQCPCTSEAEAAMELGCPVPVNGSP